LAIASTLALPAGAPVGPTLEAYAAQIQQSEGHYHEGELGQKFLLIEQALKCDCGCGLDVHSCQFQMQCGTSPVWSERIRRQLEEGLTPEAIQAGFVADFGTAVLMAPPATGFNLVGYLLPSIAIVGAGMLVGLVAKGTGPREKLAPVERVSDEDEARLAAELRRMEEAESPDW
jgi:cytochrome c-type biogenesis protein CcmH/NrfF